MRNAPLRAAIIGCGRIAGGFDEESEKDSILTHVKAYLGRSDVCVAGVADPEPAVARRFARRWNVPEVFSSAEELLGRTGADLVSICAPSETHADLLKLCLQYPVKGVWCEKPLAIDERVVGPVVEEFCRRGIPLAVNYMRRWLDQAELVRRGLQDGRWGTVVKAVGYYTKGFRHNGSHTVDLWRYWFGEPVSASFLGSGSVAEFGDCALDAFLQFKNDVPAFLVSLGDPGYSLWEVDLIGTRGRVRFRNGGYDVDWYGTELSPNFRGYTELHRSPHTVRSDLGTVMQKVLNDLIAAVEKGSPLLSDGESGLSTLALCNSLLRQVEGR